MPQFTPAQIGHILALILGIGFLVSLALYISERRKLQKLVEDNSFTSIQKKNAAILADALKTAQGIVEKSNLTVDKFEGHFEEEFKSQTIKAQETLDKHLEKIEEKSEKAQLISQSYTKERADEILRRFEKKLEAFLAIVEEKSAESIEGELAAVRQTIDSYKKQQLALVDENIIAMLERTLELILSREISLKDQSDLIFEAMEKAKAEKFIL